MADSIKVEYHPNSRRPAEVFAFEDFSRSRAAAPDPPIDQVPWSPFLSRIDFEFAELALDAALSGKQIDAFISLIHRAVKGEDLSFKNHKDVAKSWSRASGKVTRFTKHVIKAKYKNETRDYDLYIRDLWDYIKDILRDSYLMSQMDWDAYRLYRFDGPSAQWVRFLDEPFTADATWGIQSNLEDHQKPFVLILYADKTKLSSFGTQMGYPVVVRCGNLPVDIRNGEGPGGGRVVGWLPIVAEEASEKHKVGFVNLKRIVWHESFRKLLESICNHTHTGVWFECGDSVERCICPCVAILSADYEEQCMMSLIRGSGGLFPCPICLVPSSELSSFEEEFAKRKGEEVREIVNSALSASTLREREAILSKTSLRPVENAFLELANSDPYAALSFDRLHAFHSGLWGHHFWQEFKRLAQDLPKEALTRIDQQFDAIPRWKGLIHFSEVMSSSFNDGSKHEAISKACSELLCTIRPYLELDMYAGLELHTEWSMEDGRFNWNFPKAHTHAHLFDDIQAKGVSRNYNTKPNEKLHRPLKRTYHLRTNQRNVAPQILDVDHQCYVAGHMRDQIDRYDAFLRALKEKEEEDGQDAPEDPEDADPGSLDKAVGDRHFSLGAKQRKRTVEMFLSIHLGDQAFHDFAKRLGRTLTLEYKAHNIPLPDGQSIKFTSDSFITEYRLLRINYASLVDWREETDLLRCNPMFYGRPRYDCIIISGAKYDYCGRIITLFTCSVNDTLQPMALIHPYDRRPGPVSKLDADLGFYRVYERARTRSEFISLKSVIRGALLVPDFSRKGEYLVHDLVDADMFFRIKEMKGIQ
ncbi:hypothetical protein C8Q77DRAFT_1218049 [Trametes polyzona]|nr:hypothetical protein C8Q77DRAFT_1218049 [Trametes polyzona]